MGGVRVAACMKWAQPSVPPSSQTLASAISSPRRSLSTENGALLCRSAFLGNSNPRLHRTVSWETPKPKSCSKTRRICSASMDSFSDDDFSKKLQDLSSKFHFSDDEVEISGEKGSENGQEDIAVENRLCFDPLRPPDWSSEIPRGENIPVGIERRANSVELPLSLRIIKRKKQWEEGFIEAGESAYCSVKKAFSSMVFIIRELQSYTLQMREMLFYEDLQEILVRVQKEMNASFVWLFQQVFSHTPTLMVYVMILLANYSVHSIANNPAMAATIHLQAYPSAMESVSDALDSQIDGSQKFDSSSVKSFKVSSSSLGRAVSVGGSNGGIGGNHRPSASGMEGDGMFDRKSTIVPDGVSSVPSRANEEESVSGQVSWEEEMSLWNKFMEEASEMQSAFRDESLDHETMQSFVSPVNAKIDGDDQVEYFKTELLYQTGLAQEPTNTLLLANYAQFLYLVIQDYDRAENYFKKAVKVEPKDAEAFNKYANFLWQVRKDLWAAEETYLEAISADPSNSYYAANYAHFLWNTGGEDTCYPLEDSPEPEADSQP